MSLKLPRGCLSLKLRRKNLASQIAASTVRKLLELYFPSRQDMKLYFNYYYSGFAAYYWLELGTVISQSLKFSSV